MAAVTAGLGLERWVLQGADPRGIHGTRLKLRSLGVSDRQLDGIRPVPGLIENILVYASQDGIIFAIDVAQGMFITPDTTVFSLTDLSRVWVLAELLESDAPAVRPGMKAWVEAAGDLVWATGEVVAVAVERRVVTLDHAPVSELGWPGMVTDFSVGAGVSIDDLAPATRIHFAFARVPDEGAEIRALHLADATVEQTDHAGHDNHHHHPDSPDGTAQR